MIGPIGWGVFSVICWILWAVGAELERFLIGGCLAYYGC